MVRGGEGSEGGLHVAITPTTIHGRNIIASRSMMEDGGLSGLSFVRYPPVTSQQPIKWWSIHPFRFNLEAFAVYLPDNFLAVAEEKERWVPLFRGEHSATDRE